MKWLTAIGSALMGVIGFATLIASCSAVQNAPTEDVISAVPIEEAADNGGLAPGFEIFDETKLKESSAPAWTVYAVAYELCGERLAVQYIGMNQFLLLSKRNAKTDEERHEVDEAFTEFDQVLQHHGNARVEELDSECIRT